MAQSQLRFADFLNQPDEQHEAAEGDTDVAMDTTEAVESTEEDTPQEEVAEQPEEDSEEQAAPATPARVTFEDRMRAKGLAIPEDIDPEDLYDQAIGRIAAGTQALEEASRLRDELDRLKSASNAAQPAPAALPPSPPTVDETPLEKGSRLFSELKEYDQSLLQYVTRTESGTVVPKSEYGAAAVEAALTINGYEKAEQRQAQLLLRNPNLLIQENLSDFEQLAEKKARAIVEEQMTAWKTEQAKQVEQVQEEQAQADMATKFQQFHEANKAKLFHLGDDGEPLRMPFDQNQLHQTATGQYFMGRLEDLRKTLPGVSQLHLMDIAMREAEYAVPPKSQAKEAPAAPPPPVDTPAEQKRKFVQQGNAQARVPHQNVPPASASEQQAGNPTLRFSSMARSIPENQDIISGWK